MYHLINQYFINICKNYQNKKIKINNQVKMDLLQNVSKEAQQQAQDFLKIADDFKLGVLPTEQPAPETAGLSDFCHSDIGKAIDMVRSLDLKTIDILKNKVPELEPMYKDITETLDGGNKIFICGCGATGRLSLALESLWRQEVKHQFSDNQDMFKDLENRVVSFMAGGDVALIKSVEDFEDHPDFAVQHMKDLGFTKNDLLIASTEGGETPWVIGATEEAAKICVKKPWYLYCNPDDILIKTVERSRRVIQNPDIFKINLCIGNQAITGSTRMQCTTILMYAIGLALLSYYKLCKIDKEIQDKQFLQNATNQVQNFQNFYQQFDEKSFLSDFTNKEAEIYKEQNFIFYDCDYYFSLCILTDTTERSPTFSLYPFENQLDQQTIKTPALCHLVMLEQNQTPLQNDKFLQNYDQEKVRQSWYTMLGFRDIRGLEGEFWQKYEKKVSTKTALGQDFSTNIITQRKKYCREGQAKHYHFYIQKNYENQNLDFSLFDDSQSEQQLKKSINLKVFENRRLDENMFLKILLNKHSTLVMGKMNKIKSNLMSWVRPSNNKLIDRAIRYIQHLLDYYKHKFVGENEELLKKIDYSVICHALYSEMEQLSYGEAIVLKTVNRIIKDVFKVDYDISQFQFHQK